MYGGVDVFIGLANEVIDELVASDAVVYGVTTGFGDLVSERISAADSSRLQENLLISHAVGVGQLAGAVSSRRQPFRQRFARKNERHEKKRGGDEAPEIAEGDGVPGHAPAGGPAGNRRRRNLLSGLER